MSIYKECDIRGIYPDELDEEVAYLIGRAVGTIMTGKQLVVGGDVRLSTPSLKAQLIKGLCESGANTIDIGMVPTPVFYFSIKHLAADGGVTVTASHNPAKYNGFKLMFGDMPVTPSIVNDIKQLAESCSFSEGCGSYDEKDTTPEYIHKILKSFNEGQLKVVLDCCNGATGYLAPLLFKKLGYKVIPLYCEFDGSFPNRDPNPAVYDNLGDLKKKVIETRADLGVAFDGDGDRVVFVDDSGRVISGEASLVIFINEYFKEKKSSVVYDIKSSSIVRDTVLKFGGKPIPERSGHAFIKRTFLVNKSILAGEISGHFFFGELGYDDGIYAALKMAGILSEKGWKLSEIVGDIPKKLITPDIRVFCPYLERDNLLERVRKNGEKYSIILIDGVRVEFPYGWILVRKSVTGEQVTFRIEANDEDGMKKIKTWITDILPELKRVNGF